MDFPPFDRSTAEHNIRVRRRVVIISIGTIFTVTSIIMVMSMVHVEMNKTDAGYHELICQETDLECVTLLCPQGWGWVREREQCAILDGYACCPTDKHLCGRSISTRCYNISETTSPDCSCNTPEVRSAGVVTSTYKQVCRMDFIWVDWRKKCLRRN